MLVKGSTEKQFSCHSDTCMRRESKQLIKYAYFVCHLNISARTVRLIGIDGDTIILPSHPCLVTAIQ